MSKKARAAPLVENKHVRELLSIMKANNLTGAEDLLAVIRQVSAMERQLGAAVDELHAMRRELETMREERYPIKNALQNAVAAFREKGLSALRNVADFFKIRPGLEALRDSLDKSIQFDEEAVAKIEALNTRFHHSCERRAKEC